MFCIHFMTNNKNRWNTRFYEGPVFPPREHWPLEYGSLIVNVDDIVKNFRAIKSWDHKFGYNLLRETHATN